MFGSNAAIVLSPQTAPSVGPLWGNVGAESRYAVAGLAVVLLWTATGRAAGNQQQERLRMTVVVQNLTDAPVSDLERAQMTAAGVYREIGIDLTWLDTAGLERAMAGTRSGCVFANSVILLNLVPPSPAQRIPHNALGVAASGSRLVRIALSRIADLAGSADVNSAVVLGYVIAHEIGHVFLPPNSHVASGLMRAQLDLQMAKQETLLFSGQEGSRIRNGLSEMLNVSGCRLPSPQPVS